MGPIARAISDVLGIDAAAEATKRVAVRALRAGAQQRHGESPPLGERYLVQHRGPNRAQRRRKWVA